MEKIIAPNKKEYNPKNLFLVENIMNIFDISKVTVYNWLGDCDKKGFYSNGKFPNAFKLDKIYIPESDVKALIKVMKKGC